MSFCILPKHWHCIHDTTSVSIFLDIKKTSKMFVHISKKFKLKKKTMFLITIQNLNIILIVYLVKKLIINNVAYTSKGGGVYVIWGWRIHPMGVAYTSKGPFFSLYLQK